MSRRWFLMVVLLLVVRPSFLHAVSMGDMGGGMGGMTIVDKVSLQTATVGKVVFSHSMHGTNCSACHPALFEKKKSNARVSMKAMERGKSCGGCHNGKKAFNVTGDCVKCHSGDILFKEKDTGDVVFSHENHLGLFGCNECHPDLFKAEIGKNKATMDEMGNGKSCGACHDGSAAFSVAEACDSCHKM